MKSMFWHAYDFNGDLSNWDVSKVTDMSFMFWYAINFNRNLSNWNTSNVTDLISMFNGATNFKSGINIVLWNRKLGEPYDKKKFNKYLFDKLKKGVFVFGRCCIYLNMMYEEIHFRPEGLGFKECQQEFNSLVLI